MTCILRLQQLYLQGMNLYKNLNLDKVMEDILVSTYSNIYKQKEDTYLYNENRKKLQDIWLHIFCLI